jgi:serine/threonine protein kinase
MFNPGDKFDKYTLVRPLGEGGMGVVWEAKNPFGLPVVLKMLQPSLRANSDVIERFEREGRIQYTLKHPNIVRVTDIVESEDGLPALVVDFMKGRDLEERLYANCALSIEETIQIGSKVLDALQLAHEHGFFHRDLKPSNIFLEEVGKGFEPRLMDFGIAKIQAAAQLTRAQEFCGTPAYASPEQIASTKDVDHLTDIYSFGVLMWSMCTGHEPYRDMNDDPYSVLAAVVREELPTLPDTIPEWLTNIVTKATRKPKAERFQSAAEFRDALLNAAQDLSIYTPAGFDDDLGHAVDPRASESTDEVPVVKQGAAVTTTETEVSVPSLDSETDDDESAAVRAKAHAEEARAREKRQAQARERLAPNPEPLAPTTPMGAKLEENEDASFVGDSNDYETAQHANRKPPKASSRERARAREVERSFSGKRRLPKKTIWVALFVLALITGGAFFSYQYLNAATSAPAGFARVESGRFIMGSPINENGRARDERQHEVTITRPFAVQISEVTRAEWHNIMYSEPNGFEDCGENCPITDVTWVDAARFANRVSVEAGTEQCYEINDGNVEWPRGLDCTGYRLPTEAEWEYAARGGTESALFTGEIQYPGREVLDPHMSVIGWYASNSDAAYIDSIDCQSWGEDRDRCGVQPVNERRGNPWGIHDMHGNVSEWIWDRYGPYPEGGVTDPLGASSGTQRVIRGGNWRSTAENCRAATRDKSQSVARMTIGIRLVRTLR